MSEDNEEQEVGRVRAPSGAERLGIVRRTEDSGKYRVDCTGSYERNGKMPG
jgi:hypothetical protein